MNSYILAIDVGGTNIKFGLLSPKGKILKKYHLATSRAAQTKKQLIDEIVSGCFHLLREEKISKKHLSAVGIGLPGLVNAKSGIVHSLTNISGWKDIPLKKILEKKIGAPVFIDNDVNVITLGEWRYGAAKGLSDAVCLTLGTGVGAGLILDNRLYRGKGFAAGEIGHVPLKINGIKCNCGGQGCLETFIGNKFLLKKARQDFKKKNISLEEITQMAHKKETKALRFWEQVGENLGIGLTGVVNILNPSCLVIGGGVSGAYDHMVKAAAQTIKKRAMRIQGKMVKIKRSKLGSDAGILGAHALVVEMLGLK